MLSTVQTEVSRKAFVVDGPSKPSKRPPPSGVSKSAPLVSGQTNPSPSGTANTSARGRGVRGRGRGRGRGGRGRGRGRGRDGRSDNASLPKEDKVIESEDSETGEHASLSAM